MKTRLAKRGQISTEVIYSVGTMVIIFLLLTGITFNRKMDIRKIEDYLNKRTECLKISNTLSSVSAAGHGTQRTINIMYNVTIFNQSRIVVGDTAATPRTVEAVCTYTANVNTGSLPSQNVGGIALLYKIQNTAGIVTIAQAS